MAQAISFEGPNEAQLAANLEAAFAPGFNVAAGTPEPQDCDKKEPQDCDTKEEPQDCDTDYSVELRVRQEPNPRDTPVSGDPQGPEHEQDGDH